jgi:hypothetical protein
MVMGGPSGPGFTTGGPSGGSMVMGGPSGSGTTVTVGGVPGGFVGGPSGGSMVMGGVVVIVGCGGVGVGPVDQVPRFSRATAARMPTSG